VTNRFRYHGEPVGFCYEGQSEQMLALPFVKIF
jgi:hypothetical protein